MSYIHTYIQKHVKTLTSPKPPNNNHLNMTTTFLWCIILTITTTFTSVRRSSSSSRRSSSSSRRSDADADEIFDELSELFVGSYTASLVVINYGSYTASLDHINGTLSVCEANGIIYFGLILDGTAYIDRISRATTGFTVNADTISFSYEGHRFATEPTWGTETTSGVVEYNRKTKEYSMTNTDGYIFPLYKNSDEPQMCLAPGGKWSNFNEPFMAQNIDDMSEDLCQTLVGGDTCGLIHNYESVTEDGGACWCFYDFNKEECTEGGSLSINVRFDWHMALRIIE
eukprot:367283_1